MVSKRGTKPLILFPEATVSVEIENELGWFLVSGERGTGQWASYESTGKLGALICAISAKRVTEFSKGEFQLIAYLAILRENRKRANKIYSVTQGILP